jgi:hypothetical protein
MIGNRAAKEKQFSLWLLKQAAEFPARIYYTVFRETGQAFGSIGRQIISES